MHEGQRAGPHRLERERSVRLLMRAKGRTCSLGLAAPVRILRFSLGCRETGSICPSCASRNPGKNKLDSHFRGNDIQGGGPFPSPPCPSCASSSPGHASPLCGRGRPLRVIPAQAGIQAPCVRPRVIPAQAGIQAPCARPRVIPAQAGIQAPCVRPRVIPAQAEIQEKTNWIPTFVGMTYKGAPRSTPLPSAFPYAGQRPALAGRYFVRHTYSGAALFCRRQVPLPLVRRGCSPYKGY